MRPHERGGALLEAGQPPVSSPNYRPRRAHPALGALILTGSILVLGLAAGHFMGHALRFLYTVPWPPRLMLAAGAVLFVACAVWVAGVRAGR
jgi:hypothetical protein